MLEPNQAVAAQRLGGNVEFICKVGQDMFGDNAIEHYKKEGLDTSGILRSLLPSGVALIYVDSHAENCIVVASGANGDFTEAAIEASKQAILNCDILLLQLESPIPTVLKAAKMAHEAGATVVLNPAPACALPEEIFRYIDLFIPNETELSTFSGLPVTDKETADLHPKIRNTEACFVSTYKAVERARKYGTRLHVAHVSTATELSLFSNQELSEKNITAEVTPNHLWFDDRDYAQYGNLIKCNPAIKSSDDRIGLWGGLVDGLIDTIATDHAPHTWESKQKRYFEAPGGIPSIQHSLQLMLEGFLNPAATQRDDHAEVLNEWLPLIVAKMCHNPATIFGIQKRGFLRAGYMADITIVEPGETHVTKENLYYKCGWSPLEGQTFHTRIKQVFLNGMPTGQSTAMQLQFDK